MTEQELLAQPDAAYMDEAQQDFFRDLLLRQRQELQARIEGEFGELRDLERPSDEADLASREEQRQWQLRLLEREKKLLDKIDEALERLARGDYGWCQETGEPIGLRRLLLRPTATLCIEAKSARRSANATCGTTEEVTNREPTPTCHRAVRLSRRRQEHAAQPCAEEPREPTGCGDRQRYERNQYRWQRGPARCQPEPR